MGILDWLGVQRPAAAPEPVPPPPPPALPREFPIDEQHEMLDESNLTVRALERVFKRAFIRSEPVENDHLLVSSENGLKVIVHVDDERKMLKIMAFLPLREDATEDSKLQLVNTLNDKVVLARFSVHRPDVLVADYFLLYEEGLTTYQVVNSLRHFATVIQGSVAVFDHDHLIGSDSQGREE